MTTGVSTENPELSGIGGWLILLAIQNILRPVLVLADTIKQGYSADEIAAMEKFQGGLALAAFQLILAWFYVALLVFVAVLFFTKRKTFRYMYIFAWLYPFGAFSINFMLSMYIFQQSFDQTMSIFGEGENMRKLSSVFMGGLPWVLYILVSRRVANTFTVAD